LIDVEWLSVDPYLRYSMGNAFELNKPLVGFSAGVVLQSNHPDWRQGDLYVGKLPFSTVQVVTDFSQIYNVTPHLRDDELSLALGLFGMPGSTAYAALDLMGVSSRDRVWISDCCGAVGSIAGQICKNVIGCKFVLGSCGSGEKCNYAQQRLGFDKAFDYNVPNLSETIKQHAPEGLDFYLEMVGGNHLTAAVENMRPYGRIAVGGAIAGYNEPQSDDARLRMNVPVNEMTILFHQVRIEGFQCFDWMEMRRGNFYQDMNQWYHSGKVSREETVIQGIDKWPSAFAMLFDKGNPSHVGKIVVRV
jgi:NADPH-dependent curcumin reductase CurA